MTRTEQAGIAAAVLALGLSIVYIDHAPRSTFAEKCYKAGGHVVTTLVDSQLRQEDVCQT